MYVWEIGRGDVDLIHMANFGTGGDNEPSVWRRVILLVN